MLNEASRSTTNDTAAHTVALVKIEIVLLPTPGGDRSYYDDMIVVASMWMAQIG